jgi:hypothetical protein
MIGRTIGLVNDEAPVEGRTQDVYEDQGSDPKHPARHSTASLADIVIRLALGKSIGNVKDKLANIVVRFFVCILADNLVYDALLGATLSQRLTDGNHERFELFLLAQVLALFVMAQCAVISS